MTVFWLSFSGDDGKWIGGCFVEASTLGEAITVSHLRGCNPGGEVLALGPVEGTPLGELHHLYTDMSKIPGLVVRIPPGSSLEEAERLLRE